MDITPQIPSGKKIIQSYKENSFVVNGHEFTTNIIISPNNVCEWKISHKLSKSDFDILKNADSEITLFGYGSNPSILNDLKDDLKNLNLEIMNTGAACRTYNILLAEGRIVTALLIAL